MGFGERRVSTVQGYFPGVASGYLEGEVDGREIVKSSGRETRKREGRERSKEVLENEKPPSGHCCPSRR